MTNFSASKSSAQEVASTNRSISGIVNTATTFDVTVNNIDIAVLPPTACTAPANVSTYTYFCYKAES